MNATTGTKVTQEGRVYKTRKGAQNYIDGFLAEVDLGWYVVEVTRGYFIIVRPYIAGDERHNDVHTLPRVEHRAVPAAQTDPYRYLGECACGEVIPGHTRSDVTTGFRAHFAIWRDVKGHVTPATA